MTPRTARALYKNTPHHARETRHGTRALCRLPLLELQHYDVARDAARRGRERGVCAVFEHGARLLPPRAARVVCRGPRAGARDGQPPAPRVGPGRGVIFFKSCLSTQMPRTKRLRNPNSWSASWPAKDYHSAGSKQYFAQDAPAICTDSRA